MKWVMLAGWAFLSGCATSVEERQEMARHPQMLVQAMDDCKVFGCCGKAP